MTEHGTPRPSAELRALAADNPHLRSHLERHKRRSGEYPRYVERPTDDHAVRRPNVLYPTGERTFSHVYGDAGVDTVYYCVEPTLDEEGRDLYETLRKRVLDLSAARPAPADEREFAAHIDSLLHEVLTVGEAGAAGGESLRETVERMLGRRFSVSKRRYETLRYRFQRDIAGLGPLDPVMRDPQNEDIHVIGPHDCYVDHGTFGMLATTSARPSGSTAGSGTWASAWIAPSATPTRSSTRRSRTGRASTSSTPTT